MTEIKLKKMEDFVIIDYKVIAGKTTLYEGFDRNEAQKHYDNFVRQDIGVQYIYRRRPVATFFKNKDIHLFQEEVLKAAPEEIKELLVKRGAGLPLDGLLEAAGLYPDYFVR